MDPEKESLILLLVSDDAGTINSVTANLDYNQFCLFVLRKVHDFTRIVERIIEQELTGILMLDEQIQDSGKIWQYLYEEGIKIPIVLITRREAIFKSGIRYQADEILYKPLDSLEINTRLIGLRKIVEMERQLKLDGLLLGGKAKVLLVEGNAIQRNTMAKQLTGHGFSIYTAADGEEALELATSALPEVILLDLMIPKVDGLEVCRRLKSYQPTTNIPVVVTSTSQSIEEKIKALKNGAHDFLMKPVNSQELLIRIRFLLRQKQLMENLLIQASKDPLTGLNNRRQLMLDLRHETERVKRYGTPLSLILLDIDYFKKYNDTYGHPAGDEILRQVANLLAPNLRTFDKIARYGGEEFVIILPQTELKGAAAVAEKLRRLVEKHPFPGEETQPQGKLTISLGVADFSGRTDSVDDFLLQADRAMYRAKSSGRNCVAIAEPMLSVHSMP